MTIARSRFDGSASPDPTLGLNRGAECLCCCERLQKVGGVEGVRGPLGILERWPDGLYKAQLNLAQGCTRTAGSKTLIEARELADERAASQRSNTLGLHVDMDRPLDPRWEACTWPSPMQTAPWPAYFKQKALC